MVNNSDRVSEAVWSLSKSMQEAGQAVVDNATRVQERNAKFAQRLFEYGVDLLRSHAEGASTLTQELMEHPGKPQEACQAIVESAAAAQERNVRFAQSLIQGSTDTLKANVESTRTLIQELSEQAKRQQEAVQALTRESVDSYTDFLRTPLSYYEQALDTVESITWQGLETAQKIARQYMEVAQGAAQRENQAAR